ncbi:MAG TPA: glycosyltransferase, partial [Nitrococcus sp.]|nr:glycosyltransferase [Nitrococcus sp.]
VNLLALWARRLAGVATRVVISERTALSSETAARRKWRWRYLPALIHRVYPWADAIVAVSEGVAEDLARTAELPRERITTIYNPVVTAELRAQASAPLDHAWFAPGAPPVVLGAGRLLKQKDFPTLIRAFAKVRAQRPARLVILGEGAKRRRLEALVEGLGLGADAALPGYVDNPFAYMARAAVFVLSSAYEGLPGVLIQALACGTPVVATDCPHGPVEILDGGRYGRLVPVGDAAAMAAAIIAMLDQPPERQRLQARASEFCVERAMRSYRQVLASGTDTAVPAVSGSKRSSIRPSRQHHRLDRLRS